FTTITILFVTLTIISGCGTDLGPGKVSGTVTLDGQPLPDATVTFQPESGGVVPMGGTDANGKYKLYYADAKAGAQPGRYKVCVSTAAPHLGIAESVPAKYLLPETTDVIVDIKKGTNTIDVELKSDSSP
ncbi:MAG: carboxypeptidase-like regulatory domain-containing protein, partial [Planctomycetaceae bacterium]|nr:carboxypeptidase-like regulatory domain-containing protein [Planctomycetaceae bacterium]